MKSYLSKLGVLLFGAMFAVAACQDYDEDIRKVNDKLDASTAELTEITEQLDAAIADLEAKHDADLSALKAELQGEIAEAVEAAKNALEDAYKAADAQLKEGYEAADDALEAKIDAAIEQANAAIQQLAAALETAKAELKKGYEDADAALKTELLAYVDGQVADLQEQIYDLEDDIDDLYEADAELLVAINKVATDLESVQAALQAQIDELDEDIKANKVEIEKLKVALEDAKDEFEAALEAEKKAREEGDAALDQAIKDEALARANAITELTNKHQKDIEDIKTLIESEVTALEAAIAAEKKAREDADALLQDAIDAEADARAEADAALDAAIKAEAAARAEAIAELTEALEDYIEQTNAKIAALEDADAQLQENIDAVEADLAEFKELVAEMYATKEELAAEAARIDELTEKLTDLQLQVKYFKEDAYKQLENLRMQIEALTKKLEGIAVDVEALMGRIQSLVFAPDYTRNVAFIDYAVVPATPTKEDGETEQAEDLILPKLSLIRYKVNAVEAAAEAEKLAAAWAASETPILSYTLEVVSTTRAAIQGEEELKIHNVEAEGEYLYVWVTAENFARHFYGPDMQPSNGDGEVEGDYNTTYAASLRFSDGNNERATEYVNLAAETDPMIIKVQVLANEDPIDEHSEEQTLGVNETETVIDILKGVVPVLVGNGEVLTEEELDAMFPTHEITFEEERSYKGCGDDEHDCISDASFKFTGEGQTDTAQLAEELDKTYVGEALVVERTYTFGPSVATATSILTLTAERRFVTVKAIYPDEETFVPWTLQRALDLRGDDLTPYGKTLTLIGEYDFNYPLAYVLKAAEGKTITKKTYINDVPTTNHDLLKMKNMTDTQVDIHVLAGAYEFPEAGKEPNVYKKIWIAETDELYVEVTLEVQLGARPATVEVKKDVALELVPGQTYFDGPEPLVADAYEKLGAENAGFNETNAAKANDVMIAVLNDAKNVVENTPDYQTNLNFAVASNVDNSFVRLYNEQIADNILNPEGYVFKRTIDTWFGVDFIYNITAKPELPKVSLIPSEDYMSTDEDGVKSVEVFGKINSEGVYTIDLSDLGKYLGVTVGDGTDKNAELEYGLDVDFTVSGKPDFAGAVTLADNSVAVIPEVDGPVAEKSGILRFGQLKTDEAIVDWNDYEGIAVDVNARLVAEGKYAVDTLNFELRTKDPLTVTVGETIHVTRVPGMSANARIYENVKITSAVEPAVENLVDNSAASLQEIFAKSNADKTYGLKVEAVFGGMFVDENLSIPYSKQKYNSWEDIQNFGIITLYPDDGQLLYPLYAVVNLTFTHKIHGEVKANTKGHKVVIVFEPSEDAKVMMNKFTNGGEIKLEENLLLTQPLVIDNPNAVVTLDLNGKTIQNISKETDSEQYAIRVKQGKLIVRGEGTVDGGSGCKYNIALRVDGGAVAYVEGGFFKVGPDSEDDVNHAVYAADGGKVFISGGKFQSPPQKGTVPAVYTTLNLKDNTGASIVCTGGEFVNFNPENNVSEPEAWRTANPKQFVAEGYKAVLKEYSTTDYVVVAE